MKLDPTKMKDWQIAEAAEENLKSAAELVDELGLKDDEWTPYGKVLAKVDVTKVLKRVGAGRRGKYIDVTAITPTALGEGKTTTTLGLVEGLGKLGKKVVGCVRQPSGGPTFNIKGSAAGGGLAQVVPLTSLSLGLTGDIDAITNANNLAMVALNSRMQHERNHDDAWLAERCRSDGGDVDVLALPPRAHALQDLRDVDLREDAPVRRPFVVLQPELLHELGGAL
ncbi:MAG: formate--tetrahydrofolate ligase [Kiritimatiellae bacterium]|nr:formate--tetrahydrofolate ligase [Kiritimatiellia bacterium]